MRRISGSASRRRLHDEAGTAGAEDLLAQVVGLAQPLALFPDTALAAPDEKGDQQDDRESGGKRHGGGQPASRDADEVGGVLHKQLEVPVEGRPRAILKADAGDLDFVAFGEAAQVNGLIGRPRNEDDEASVRFEREERAVGGVAGAE